MRGNECIAHISAFGQQRRIEKRGGNSRGAVSCCCNLCDGEEDKVKFSRGEIVIDGWKICIMATYNIEIDK